MKPTKIIYFYFILVLIYFSQAFITSGESSIGKPVLVVIMLINIYYLFKDFQFDKTPQIIKAITLFVAVNTIYYIIGDAFISNVPATKSFQIYKTILLSTTCIYPLYYWSKCGYSLNKLSLVLAGLYFLAIYYSGTQRSYVENYVDNMGYYYLNFIPFLLLIPKHTYIKIGICLILNILIITCAKRGAILTAVIVDIVFFFYIYKSQEVSKSTLSKIWITFLLCVAAAFAWNKFTANSFVLERFEALEQGHSSGRDIIYANLWNNWSHDYDLIQQILGGGFCKSPRLNNGLFAHNDWLELLTDLGLVGVISYLIVIICMISLTIKTKDTTTKFILLCVCVIWIFKTLFSMSYLDENNFILMMLTGIMAAKPLKVIE